MRRAAQGPSRAPTGGRSSVRTAAAIHLSCRSSSGRQQRRRTAPTHTRRRSGRRRRLCPAAARSTMCDRPSAPAELIFRHCRHQLTTPSTRPQRTHSATRSSRLPRNSSAHHQERRSPAAASPEVTTATRSTAPRSLPAHWPDLPRSPLPHTSAGHCTTLPSTARNHRHSPPEQSAPPRPRPWPAQHPEGPPEAPYTQPPEPVPSATRTRCDTDHRPSSQPPRPARADPMVEARTGAAANEVQKSRSLTQLQPYPEAQTPSILPARTSRSPTSHRLDSCVTTALTTRSCAPRSRRSAG
jgi:hypothetical protein